MTDFVGHSGDGMIWGLDGTPSYATARSTSTNFDITDTRMRVGQFSKADLTPTVQIWRDFLKFDTSDLSESATISSVKLGLTVQTDNSSRDFDVQIVKQDWSSQDPITSGTREAAYDGCLAGTADNSIWRNTSGISTNTPYESGELDTTWVNKTGITYYSLRSSKDYDNNAPPSSPVANEDIWLYTNENTTAAYRPYLVIQYNLNHMKVMMKIHA